MAKTQQEAFIEGLERAGPEAVRHKLNYPGPIPYYAHPQMEWAAEWLGEKDAQRLAANEASQSLQTESASRAAAAAERAATAAERANAHANMANTIAVIAAVVAAISLLISIFRPFSGGS